MGATLLSLVNDAQDTLNLPRSATVIGSIDQNTRNLVALANRIGRELARKYVWRMLISQVQRTTTATTEQIEFFPTFFDRLIDDTMWNQTRLVPMYGPMTEEEWQTLKIQTVSSLYPVWRHKQGSVRNIFILPVPDSGEKINYSCMTNGWCLDASAAAKTAFTADDDTTVYDDELMILGLVYRWRRGKQLEGWQLDEQSFMQIVREKVAQDGARRTVTMAHRPVYDVDPPVPVIPDQITV